MLTPTVRALTAAGAGSALLLTGLATSSPAQAREDDVLLTGERLSAGDSLVSPSGRYQLTIDGAGMVVLLERSNWLSRQEKVRRSWGDADYLVLQEDGNLVGYDDDPHHVDFTTGGSGARSVRLDDDGNLVFADGTGAVVAQRGERRIEHLGLDEVMLPGDQVSGEGGVSRLLMQTDGNLVLYRDSTPLWSSGTQGNPGAAATFQVDGNLVVYSPAATGIRALFDTGTSGALADPESPSFLDPQLTVEDTEVSITRFEFGFVVRSGAARPNAQWGSNWGSDRVLSGDELNTGDRRVSRDRRCLLIMQTDANLVQYCDGQAAWSSGVPLRFDEADFIYANALMQSDGNLVVNQLLSYYGTRPGFNTSTQVPGSSLLLQTDGNLVVQAPTGRPMWSRLTGRLG